MLGNGTGVIDADYTGPLLVSAWNRNPDGPGIRIEPGDRIAQLVFTRVTRPSLSIRHADAPREDSVGGRGSGGFGSTGRR